MNKMQWHTWGAVFLLLALTLMMIQIAVVKSDPSDPFVWLVGRQYFLAIWVFFLAAFGCIASGYYNDYKEMTAQPMRQARPSRRSRARSRRR